MTKSRIVLECVILVAIIAACVYGVWGAMVRSRDRIEQRESISVYKFENPKKLR